MQIKERKSFFQTYRQPSRFLLQMHFYYKVYVGLSGLSVLLSLSTNILGQVAAARGRQRLHRDMLQNLVKCAVRFFDTTPAGRIMNRFTTDTAMIDKVRVTRGA